MINGDGRWTSSHHWTLPSINATGIIRNADTGMVLGIVDRDSGEYEPNNMVKKHYLSFALRVMETEWDHAIQQGWANIDWQLDIT